MHIQVQSPKQSLNKAYLKTKVERAQLDLFKANLSQFLHKAKQAIERQESEEHLKNLVKDFLKDTYYKDRYELNTRGRADLVIHHGPTAQNTAAVLMEVKRPGNKAEMISQADINRKAMHEAVLYYLRERIEGKNTELKYIIITNIYEWYIFNAADFESVFHKNTALKKAYQDWSTGKLVSKNTDLIYEHINDVLKQGTDSLPATYVDLYSSLALAETSFLTVYKIFSPPHLLKESFANDSNTLDNKFYQELLHIIGLEEIKEGGKKLIRPKAKPDPGSLFENTLQMLKVEGRIGRLINPRKYGNTQQEIAQNMALELCITWINRILFLKLLEAQLYRYHHKEVHYRFLKEQTINDFDELNKLFFQVLALKPSERTASIQSRYGHVPYLNSSLFEITDLEDEGIRINSLDDHVAMPVYSGTVLKNEQGKALKNAEFPSVLPYLLRFLDAYDFGAEGKGEVQEENKTLITASVLGLIFEKINGYKDGSFYTPGFITMYMCRETLRRAVVQKFNAKYGWNCDNIEEVNDSIYRQKVPLKEANELINNLHICDPAVGSGHFLVSALNELIAIKADLHILTDSQGKLLRYDSISVANDELVVTDSHGDLFEYTINKSGNVSPEKHLLQESLFREKQHMIENCLFGVDINPNSVKICRLRLWIELLKNAYYTSESNYKELHTLPNIDINIKQGNSLLSRFALDEDLSEVFKKQKFSLKNYRLAVQNYKETNSKEAKGELLAFIKEIKDQFRTSISKKDPLISRMAFVRGTIENIKGENIFGEKNLNEKTFTAIKNKLQAEGLLKRSNQKFVIENAETVLTEILDSLEEEKSTIEANRIYEGAFEWRFEFPEVLDEIGNYEGFDVVIGNPPYIRQEELGEFKLYLQKHFQTYTGTADLFVYFIEKGIQLLKPDGNFIYIVPNKWMKAGYGKALRIWLKNFQLRQLVDFGDLPVFEEATIYPSILSLSKSSIHTQAEAAILNSLKFENGLGKAVEEKAFHLNILKLNDEGWSLSNSGVSSLLEKLKSTGLPLGKYVEGKIYRGILTGLNEAFVIDEVTKLKLIDEDSKSAEIIRPFLAGRDIKRYMPVPEGRYLILFPKGWTKKQTTDNHWEWLQTNYPAISSYLEQFAKAAQKRGDKGDFWWELRACDYYNEFDKPKLLWPGISADLTVFTIDKNGFYGSDNIHMVLTDQLSMLGILNSSLSKFFLKNTCDGVQGGYYRMKMIYISSFPIVRTPEKSLLIEQKVFQILETKKANPHADTSVLEKEIDQMVYELYGLTEEEIAIVEGEKVEVEA